MVASWLLDLTAAALVESPELAEFAGPRLGLRRGPLDRRRPPIDEGVPAHVLTASLFSRFSSRGQADYGDKLLSAMRKQFGGHARSRPPEAAAAGSPCRTARPDLLAAAAGLPASASR